MIPLIGALLPLLTKAGEKFIESKFPDPEEREQAKREWAAQAAQLEASDIQGFRDFVVAYEGAGESVHPAIQILRGSVRPVLTYFLAASYVYGFLHPVVFPPEAMDGLWKLNLISLGFWYGERALKNLGLNLNRGPVNS